MDKQVDALLAQLQQRFLVWSEIDSDDSSIELRKALTQLVTQLYHAQLLGRVVRVSDYERTFPLSIALLCEKLPHLITKASTSQSTPIIVYQGFVSFRRDYCQLTEMVSYLQRSSVAEPLSKAAFSAVNWQLAQGYALNEQQKIAAISVATQTFCVITGGAGTGKTTTLTKGLELLLLENPKAEIVLAAPTGKAAHRLNESLALQLDSVNSQVRSTLAALSAKTIHRLLGISAKTGRAHVNAQNPLHGDILVIDEASMIGGDLFLQIKEALLPTTRLILLGDANQLPAINSSAFFNEVSQLPSGYSELFCQQIHALSGIKLVPKSAPLPDAICQLSASYRFAEQSIVQQVSQAILAKDVAAFRLAIGEQFYSLNSARDYREHMVSTYPTDKVELLATLSNRIVLCANRQGYFGSEEVNRYLDMCFHRILADTPYSEGQWYVGRRIIIEKNDYMLGLYNGDIGCCQWVDGLWQIIFEDNRQVRANDLLAGDYSLAFAISIHKSQGSEYEMVDIVLDCFDKASPDNILITDKLLYTGVTRARKQVFIYGDMDLISWVFHTSDTSMSPLQAML